MRETSTITASQTQQLAICSSAEHSSDQHILVRMLLWIWRCLLLKNADHPTPCQMRKSMRPRWLFVNVALCLVLVGPYFFAPFIGQQTAWAAEAHLTHQASPTTAQISCPKLLAILTIAYAYCILAKVISELIPVLTTLLAILKSILNNDLAGWIACMISAGLVSCPNAVKDAWGFECPGASSADKSAYEQAINSPVTKKDWLSGDVSNIGSDSTATESSYPSGHLIYTYATDTTQRDGVTKLLPFTLGFSLLLIGPLFVVVGYQFLMAAWKFNSPSMLANAIEGIGRIALAALAVVVSYQVTQMLINLANITNYAMILLHKDIGFPQTTINGRAAVSYSIAGDTPESFRGLVMPMSLWGCVLDDFLGIIATRMVNGISAMIPIVGGLLSFAGKVKEIVLLLKDLSEFVLFLLSVTIWAQAVIRIILINYYIILAPLAFACWGLPGPMGNKVLMMWLKGILQLLFMQALQLFILSTLPSLLPDFGQMTFPIQNNPRFDVMDTILVQLPVVITTMAAVRAPKILMGMSAIQTVAQAGSMAGKAVGGVAATIYGITNH
jgi:hypothetical protein